MLLMESQIKYLDSKYPIDDYIHRIFRVRYNVLKDEFEVIDTGVDNQNGKYDKATYNIVDNGFTISARLTRLEMPKFLTYILRNREKGVVGITHKYLFIQIPNRRYIPALTYRLVTDLHDRPLGLKITSKDTGVVEDIAKYAVNTGLVDKIKVKVDFLTF